MSRQFTGIGYCVQKTLGGPPRGVSQEKLHVPFGNSERETRGKQCFHQTSEIVGSKGVESKALVSNPAPILREGHYCTINCRVLAYV